MFSTLPSIRLPFRGRGAVARSSTAVALLALAGLVLYPVRATAAGLPGQLMATASPGSGGPSSAGRVAVLPARMPAVQRTSPASVTITFSEFPDGTVITDQYANDYGIVFQGDRSGDDQFITEDSANPDSPEISGTPLFAGDVGAHFVVPGTTKRATVHSVSMDVGYIDNPGSTLVKAYDSKGKLLGTVVANQVGWNHLTLSFPGIASFIVKSVANEDAGFGVDNVTFVPPKQKLAVASVTIKADHGTGTALPADVIADRVDMDAQTIDQFSACGATSDAQWVDCSPSFPDGMPEKAWPVVFMRGTNVTLSKVDIKIKDDAAKLNGSVVTGTTTVGGSTLTFTSGPVDPTNGEFVVTDLTSDNPLPNSVNTYPMKIQWTVTHKAFTFDAGSSKIPIYLTYGTPGFAAYLSLEDLTARAAAGQTTEADVFNSIWTNVFSASGPSALAIHPVHLDPATGAVTPDTQTLQYWTPWTLDNDYLYLIPHPTCEHLSTPLLLRKLISRCGDWAEFFSNTLSVQGITTVRPTGVGDGGPVLGPFPTFPQPSPPHDEQPYVKLMLISKWAWNGPATGADPNFPYVTTDTVRLSTGNDEDPVPGTGHLGPSIEFDDLPGAPGQHDANPPGYFAYEDHVIDVYNGMIYDPSYGIGPFANISAWANVALAGFAYVTYVDKTEDGHLVRVYKLHGHQGLS